MAAPQKKYVCIYCARAFTRLEHKQRHERSHNNEKPFHCLSCTSAFVRRDLLQRHCRTVHHIHRMTPEMLREKELTTPQEKAQLPKYSSFSGEHVSAVLWPSDTEEKKFVPRLEVCSEVHGEDSSVSAKSSVSSSTKTTRKTNKIFGSPVLRGIDSKDRNRNIITSSIGDASLIASARVLLQLAPKKSEPCDFALASYQPHTPLSSSGGSNDITTANVLTRAHTSTNVGMLPDSTSLATQSTEDEKDSSAERLLQAAQVLQQLCDPCGRDAPIADMFCVGYSVLNENPVMLKLQQTKVQSSLLSSYLQGAAFSNFDIGVSYTISAIGAINMSDAVKDYQEVARDLMNKALTFIIQFLMPRYTLYKHQLEIVNNLYLLAHTYLKYFNNDLMIGYLEETTNTLLERVLRERVAKELLKSHMETLWNVYILISKCKIHSTPPKFYSWMLSQNIDGFYSLSHYMLSFLRGPMPMIEPLLAELVSCTFCNETNNLLRNNALAVYASRVDLHTAIELACESMVKLYPYTLDNFELQKRIMLHDLLPLMQFHLKQRICRVAAPYQWQVLSLAIMMADQTLKSYAFITEHAGTPYDRFGEAFLKYLKESTVIRSSTLVDVLNVLSTHSYSLILNSKLLHVRSIKSSFVQDRVNVLERNLLSTLVLQWFLTLIDYFVFMLTQPKLDLERTLSENTLLQVLIFITGCHPVQSNTRASDVILQLCKEVSAVCELWLDLNKNEYQELRVNLSRFLSNLFFLASNNDHFSIFDVRLVNGSLSLNDGNPYTDYKERRSMSLSLPVDWTSNPNTHTVNRNYVLIKLKESMPSDSLPSIEKSLGATLPPLLAVNKLPMPHAPLNGPFLSVPNVSFVEDPPFLLPRLHHNINERSDMELLP